MTNTQNLEPHVNRIVEGLTKELRKLNETLERPSFEMLQSQMLAVTNEAVRRTLELVLQQRADEFPQFVSVDGVVYRRHQEGRVQYHDLCGPLWVRRATYRRVDKRNGATIVPLDLSAGLISRTTPALAFAVTQGHAQAPSREVEQGLQAAHRCPPSRATLDRLGRKLGGALKQALPKIEPVVRSEEQMLDGAHGLSLGLDRTTVPMAENEGDKVRVHYRMAYVGTVTVTDDHGDSLQTRRYAAAAHEGPHGIIKRMMADVRWALIRKPSLHLVLVQDGADEMWNLMRPALKAEPLVKSWREVIDWYHVTERLAAIAELMESDAQRRQKRLERWKASLLKNDRAIYRIIKTMEAHWVNNGRVSTTMSDHLTYFMHAPKMRYASLRANGLPIGSGVTEGACKSLITMRAKRSGQRWRKLGIEAVLAVRATAQSERLRRSWSHFSKQFTASICAA